MPLSKDNLELLELLIIIKTFGKHDDLMAIDFVKSKY